MSARITRVARAGALRGLELAIAAFGAVERHALLRLAVRAAGVAVRASRCARGLLQFVEPGPAHHPHGDVAARSSPAPWCATRGRRAGPSAFLYGDQRARARRSGALATPWVFIRHHGIARRDPGRGGRERRGRGVRRRPGRAGNGGPDRARRETRRPAEATAEATSPEEAPRPFGLWLALYALSGFCALALEILWFRVMDVAVKSTAYTFGTLLAVYLLGSATGSLAGIAIVRRVRRPLRAFLVLQCVLLALRRRRRSPLLTRMPGEHAGTTSGTTSCWGGPRSFNLGGAMYWGAFLRLYVVLPAGALRPAHPAHGPLVPDPAARGAGRSRDQRTEGGRAAGREHRGLRGGEPRSSASAPSRWLGTPGTMRLLLVAGPRLRRARPARVWRAQPVRCPWPLSSP